MQFLSISPVSVRVNREFRSEFPGLPLKAPLLHTRWLCLWPPGQRKFAAWVAKRHESPPTRESYRVLPYHAMR